MKYSETLIVDCSKERLRIREDSQITGGGERNRTADLYVANVAL